MNEQEPIITIRIKELRRERSLTQEELAEQLGLSRQSVNALEAGRCMPSLPVAFQIARFFSSPLSRVFVFNDPELRAEIERFEEAHASHKNIQNSISKENYPPNHKEREENMSTLIPWNPLREMRGMLDDMLDENAWPAVTQISVPAVNIHQTANEVKLEMRLPGFKKEDLSIEVGEDFISISGEVKVEDEKKDENKQYFRREFAAQSFTRTLALPALVQTDKAEAEVKHGVLHITLPKVVEEKPKTSKVSIKSEE